MKTICINCPMGCQLTVEKNGDEIIVTGNSCARGLKYGKEEITAPQRVVTSLVKGNNVLYSVKTSTTIPKEMIFDVLKFISQIKTGEKEYQIGENITKDILGTGADLVVTGKNNL